MKRRHLSRVLLLVVALVLVVGQTWAAEQVTEIHVTPTGQDTNAGTKEKPLATIDAARQAASKIVRQMTAGQVRVVIHDGAYRIQEPIVFTSENGGTESVSVTYTAASGERPLISGGRTIAGFKANDDGTWGTEIPEVKSGLWSFRQLYTNGARAVRAREPDDGWFRVEKVGKDRRTNFTYRDGDVRPYANLDSLELVFLHDWSITRCPVKSIDAETRTLTVPVQVGGNTGWAVMDWFEKEPRYFVENARELLDTPGEWYLDEAKGQLTYMPRADETIESAEFVAPVADQLLMVCGTQDKPVRNLHIVGLQFEHAGWKPVNRHYWGRQACTYWTTTTADSGRSHEEADPAAVQFNGAVNCSLNECGIAHVGATGLWFGANCRDNVANGCAVADVGGNGIMIGEGQARTIDGEPWWSTEPDQAADGNTIRNCLVEKSGCDLYGAVGVWVGLAARTTIEQNEIRNHPYTGVSIGWMWWNPRSRPEPRSTPCRQTLVVRNHIHHVMQVLSDGGCVYSLGVQPDSRIAENLIHDVQRNAGRAESNGMFLDQGCGDFVIEKNVIYNIDRSPLRFHKGWVNVVRDNVLAVGPGIPPVRYNDTKEERITLENNTVVEPGEELDAAIARLRGIVGPRE
jgi:glycosyl hydrolase family 141